MDLQDLNGFIVEAKARTYAGGGKASASSRLASHDIGFERGNWRYLDSYFGGTDFAGQEVVWLCGEPVWAMNYFGRIILSDRIDAAAAGTVIKTALTALYSQGRFLNGFTFEHPLGHYRDASEGDCAHFRGREVILVRGREAYELDYRGGLIIP